MKIGVFGDSFADRSNVMGEREDESWMRCLERHGHTVITYGLGATSTYWSYTQFIRFNQQFDHIIFCYSALDRIHAMPEKLETFSDLKSPDDIYSSGRKAFLSLEDEIKLNRILTGYVPSYNFQFNMFVKQKIFDDINIICKKHDKKLINILPFEVELNGSVSLNYENQNGICLFNLLKVVEKECGLFKFRDPRFCHLSKENNEVLANIILESLQKTNTKEIIDLYKENRFLYTDEIFQRYRNFYN